MDDLHASTQEKSTGLPTRRRVVRFVASRASKRLAYADVVEHSVYVHLAVRGGGVGLASDRHYRKLQVSGACGPAFSENTASLALHQCAGFRIVGTRDRPGRLHGRWRDVVLVGRRSPIVT